MNIDWNQVIVQAVAMVGGGGVVIMGVAWLARKLVSEGLSREAEAIRIQIQANANQQVEAFKIRLEADANSEIETLKNSLQIAAEEHKVRFSKLHDIRAVKIAHLYEQLVKLTRASHLYVAEFGGADDKDRRTKFDELRKEFAELDFSVEITQIYLPDNVCVLLRDIVSRLHRAGLTALTHGQVNQFAPPENQQRSFEAVEKALMAFEGEIPAAKRALENECRKLFGVDIQGLS